MGLFRRNDERDERLRSMQEQLEAMAARLDRADADNVVLREQVGKLDAVVSTPPPPPPASPAPPAPPERTVEQVEQQLAEQIDSLSAIVGEHRDRLADLATVASAVQVDGDVRAQVGMIAEKMAALDGRVTQVSVELANQLSELGGELDALQEAARRHDAEAVSDKLGEIASGQTRLANEQARYEIQFRQDLAELAERIRRPGAS